ncbi:helix-turn-helix domain-containing protein [uncultured Vagococcus sp.]|uniref:helix-turn-helix domain-containing protein n=1 Tax=uncultured Vagococcus sp. TaxID=189676 RepID=UPI0028D7D295|nr:helix-turn-helix domain-containing protein [uncultured Vagococcus sp.]
MKRLLSKENWRALLLIEQLYEKEWVVSDRLMGVIKCSERTLRSDVQRINQLIEPATIETSLKTGLRLRIPTSHSMKHIYAILLRESPNFLILETLFFSDFDSLVDLAREVYQSLASLNRSISQINQITSEMDFRITTKPPIRIAGNEREILAFFRSYFFERYEGEFPFNQEKFQEVLAVLNQFYGTHKQFIFIINFTMLALYIFIKATRLQQQSESLSHAQTSICPISEEIIRLNQDLSNLTGLRESHVFFSDDWSQINEDIYFCSYQNFQKGIQRFPAVKAEYDRFRELTMLIDEVLIGGINDHELFIFRLYSFHLSEQLVRPILFNYPEETLATIAASTPYFYEKIKGLLVKYIRKNHNYVLKTLLYNVMSAFDNFSTVSRLNQPAFRIGLYTKYNGLIVTNDQEFLEDVFGDQVEVRVIPFRGCQKSISLQGDYDLIITDISDCQLKGIEVLSIAYEITEREIGIVKELYDHFLKRKAASLFDG